VKLVYLNINEDMRHNMAEKKKWIQGAIKHPGSLRKSLGAKKGEPIPERKLQRAAAKGGLMGERARLAETLKRLHKK
jgi:hypothetical protein